MKTNLPISYERDLLFALDQIASPEKYTTKNGINIPLSVVHFAAGLSVRFRWRELRLRHAGRFRNSSTRLQNWMEMELAQGINSDQDCVGYSRELHGDPGLYKLKKWLEFNTTLDHPKEAKWVTFRTLYEAQLFFYTIIDYTFYKKQGKRFPLELDEAVSRVTKLYVSFSLIATHKIPQYLIAI